MRGVDLRRLLSSAMDRAICDIIQPVIERSASIACMTAHELVNKVRGCIVFNSDVLNRLGNQ